MIARGIDAADDSAADWATMRAHAVGPVGAGVFNTVWAGIDAPQAFSMAAPGAAPPIRGPAFEALARQLDDIGRQRLEAQRLSGALAGAWATSMDAETLAVAMHRHTRAMATYHIGVMWGAKLIGVAAGALRQLAAAN